MDGRRTVRAIVATAVSLRSKGDLRRGQAVDVRAVEAERGMGRSMACGGRYRGLLIGLRAQGGHLAQGTALRASLAGPSVTCRNKAMSVTPNSALLLLIPLFPPSPPARRREESYLSASKKPGLQVGW